MRLYKGTKYDTGKMELTGWARGDEYIPRGAAEVEGYALWAYFDDGSCYIGPDIHGIEPDVEFAEAYKLVFRSQGEIKTSFLGHSDVVGMDDGDVVELAERELAAWVEDGDYGPEGGAVAASVSIYNLEAGGEPHIHSVVVTIPPDHEELIRLAGGDTDCDHEWTSEGEAGCQENPGVWSVGEKMVFRRHCAVCGVIREEIRNIVTSESSWEYSLPEDEDE